jgi:hypothetical protein
MNKPLLGLAISACLLATPSAQALHLSNNGSGEVLLFPYYTVNSLNQTLVSIVNSTDHGKATRLLFREGRNSRVVMELSIYLAAHDVWTGTVLSLEGGGAASIMTTDNSCTVPALKTSVSLPQIANGTRYAPFSNAAYTGSANDAGPDDLARTREGHFELIEMGEVSNDSFATLVAITHQADGVPPGCQNLVQAWAPGGYWQTNSDADLNPPGGGLYGSAYIVDVLNGTMQMVAADAIAGFSKHVLNTPPGQGTPTLAAANEAGFGEVIFATVFADGAPLVLEYPREQAIDAMSAVLMADQIHNEFVTGASVGGASEWVVTFPTKHFYTDVGNGAPIAPFARAFAATQNGGAAAVDFSGRAWSRAGLEVYCIPAIGGSNCESNAPPVASALNWAANVVTFNQSTNPAVPFASAIFGSGLSLDINTEAFYGDQPDTPEGAFRLTFWDELTGAPTLGQQLLRADNRGRRLRGLPVQGFWVASYTNGQLTPGLLSNYSDAVRHQTHTSIELPAQ